MSALHQTCYMPCLSHSSRFDHPNHIRWGVPNNKLIIMQIHIF
jgi:hypothetical protein